MHAFYAMCGVVFASPKKIRKTVLADKATLCPSMPGRIALWRVWHTRAGMKIRSATSLERRLDISTHQRCQVRVIKFGVYDISTSIPLPWL